MQSNPPISRRALLERMGTGLGVLGLAGLLKDNGLLAADIARGVNPLAPKVMHFAPRAKHVIHLFMNGGPSQVDTFDPKPGLDRFHGKMAPDSIKIERNNNPLMRSPFTFSRHGAAGIEVSELYPNVAQCIDDICVIRSMHTNTPNHEPSLLMMTCGDNQPVRPAMGSWLLYGLGSENQNLPGFVVMCPGKPVVGPQLWSNSFLPGIFQGTQIDPNKLDPKTVMADIDNPYLSRGAQREELDLMQEMNRRHLEQRGGRDNPLESRIASLEMAFRMQTEAQDVFDLKKESNATRELYGKGMFADACLTARRLVQSGVRMVQVFTGAGQPWDDHGDIMAHRDKAQQTDQPIAALLRDLKSRGMLDDTLVLWGGEFGRTPSSQGGKGRDHNNAGFSVWLAGGGIKGGMTYGSTDVHDLRDAALRIDAQEIDTICTRRFFR